MLPPVEQFSDEYKVTSMLLQLLLASLMLLAVVSCVVVCL